MKRFLKECAYAMGLCDHSLDESGFNIDVRTLEFRKHFQRALAYLTRDENVNAKIINAAIDSFKDQKYFIYTIETIWLALHQLTEEQKEECTELGATLMKKHMAERENKRLDRLFAKYSKEYASSLGEYSPLKDMILKTESEINAPRAPIDPESSPVLSKEELQELPAKIAAVKEQEEADRQAKLDEAFFSKSIGILPWVSVDKAMPEFTKEDYLNQDSYCLLRHKFLDVVVGLYCPLIGRFRKLKEYFEGSEEDYDDLLTYATYEFYDAQEITHWVKLSKRFWYIVRQPSEPMPEINSSYKQELDEKQKEESMKAWNEPNLNMALQYNKESGTPINLTVDFPMKVHGDLVTAKPGTVFLVKPKEQVNLDDLPWIPISERTPNYTFEQFRIEESKVLVKTEDGIEMALFSPNTRSFYQTIDSEPYPLYAVTEWFPISTESV